MHNVQKQHNTESSLKSIVKLSDFINAQCYPYSSVKIQINTTYKTQL